MPDIDHVFAGRIVAYDARTGKVLWVHEKFVEVVRNRGEPLPEIGEMEKDQLRDQASSVFRSREITVLLAPPDVELPDNARVAVDSQEVVFDEAFDEPRGLTDIFSAPTD